MDIVGMHIERRLWHQEVANDEVLSIQCYSDSSPVAGLELQGAIADVNKRGGSRRRVTLPGGSVYYGMQGATRKTNSFLWAVWYSALTSTTCTTLSSTFGASPPTWVLNIMELRSRIA